MQKCSAHAPHIQLRKMTHTLAAMKRLLPSGCFQQPATVKFQPYVVRSPVEIDKLTGKKAKSKEYFLLALAPGPKKGRRVSFVFLGLERKPAVSSTVFVLAFVVSTSN